MKIKNCRKFEDYVLPNYREMTEVELYEVNGGKQIENTNEAVANAQVGDTLIRYDKTEVIITQGDIDYAREHCGMDNGSTDMNRGENHELTGCGFSDSDVSFTTNSTISGDNSNLSGESNELAVNFMNDISNEIVPSVTQYITIDKRGHTYAEKEYGDKYVLAVPAGYAQNYLNACNAYFGGRKDGNAPGRKVDGIALTNTDGKVIHFLSTDEAIEEYRKFVNVKVPELDIKFSNGLDLVEGVLSTANTSTELYEQLTKSDKLSKLNKAIGGISTVIDIYQMKKEPTFRNGYNLCADVLGFIPGCGLISLGMNAFSLYADYKIESKYGKPEAEDSNPYIYKGEF